MRLPVEKIKEAIVHPDQDVRTAAVQYFAQSFSADPTIMPLAIQAIERFGFGEAFETHEFMVDLVQTSETVVWLVEQLERLGTPNNEVEAEPILAYLPALAHADPLLLQAHRERIVALAELDNETRCAIEDRITFASRPPADLWQELEELCRGFDAADEAQSEDIEYANRLVEALSRHPDANTDKLLEILSGDTDDVDTWIETFVVRLAGERKWEAAVPLLICTLHDANDWLEEECHRALAKIGSDAVVAGLAQDYPQANIGFRISTAFILRDIHSDLGVQTSLALLQDEEDDEIKSLLLEAILLNFATEGIEPARQFILNRPLDPDVIEVRLALLTACKLMGETFPEFDAWLEGSKNDQEFRKAWHQEQPEFDEDEDWDDEYEGDGDDDWDDAPYEEDDFRQTPRTQPLVIEEPRVGRNDPCPCGSGKKYKKCCYKNRGDDAGQDSAWSGSDLPMLKAPPKYPLGTVAFYGPDDKTTTKIAAGIILWDGAEPIIERWVGTNVKDNPKVKRQMEQFFKKHGVTTIAMSDGNMGCPHEEGPDFPQGEDCPFCPFWKGKQGSSRRQ